MYREQSMTTPYTIDRSTRTNMLVTLRRVFSSEWLLFVLFVGPNLLLFGVFTYWPLIYTFFLSTRRWDMIGPVKRDVGLDNYRYLYESETFRTVLTNTAIFTIGAVGGSMVLGLMTALLLNQKLKGRDAARAIVFMPTLLSGAAIGIVWVYMFDPRYGLIRTVIDPLGLNSPNWLRSTGWALPAIIIVYVWKNLGFAAVIYLAGLQGIPKDLYEASRIDGAGAWWRFKSVTMPMLSPITFFLVITSILNSFQAFDIIRAMTRGGPVDATNTLIYYIYEEGFLAFNAGRASAAAVVLFVVMLAITLTQMKFQEKGVHYGG